MIIFTVLFKVTLLLLLGEPFLRIKPPPHSGGFIRMAEMALAVLAVQARAVPPEL